MSLPSTWRTDSVNPKLLYACKITVYGEHKDSEVLKTLPILAELL